MDVASASKEFARMLRAGGATEEGIRTVLQMVDPFHDTKLQMSGLPDSTNGQSVVSCVPRRLEISNPFASGSWDCHIAFVPLVRNAEYRYYQSTYGVLTEMDAAHAKTALPAGEVIVNCCGASQNSFYPTRTSTQSVYTTIDFDELRDRNVASRLVGGGFEVTNTTAVDISQGTVTVYNQEHCHPVDGHFVTVTDAEPAVQGYVASVPVIRGPPVTSSQALALDGHTWNAAKGCYMVFKPEARNPPTKMVPKAWVLEADSVPDYDDVAYVWAENDLALIGSGHTPDEGVGNPSLSKWLPYMTSGAYFRNLPDDAVLTLTTRTFIEIFPDPNNSTLGFCTPSPALDPVAMLAIDRIQSMLLAGCPVDDNGMGDHFRRILGAAATFLPQVSAVARQLSSFGVPYAAQVGVIADTGARGAKAGQKLIEYYEKKMSKSQKRRRRKRLAAP